MTTLKSARILAASLGVLAFGALAATPAMAFDNLEWNWQKDVKEKVDIDVYIDVNVDMTGLVEVEKLQIFLGDAKAHNYVEHIYNNPFYEGAGYHDDYYSHDPKEAPRLIVCQYGKDCGGGYGDKNRDWDKIPVKPLDARYELPILLANASAIGNNQSISSDVGVFVHDGQYVANVRDRDNNPCNASFVCYEPAAIASALPTYQPPKPGEHTYGPDGNLFHDLAKDFLRDAKYGRLVHAEIEAKSYVEYVTNVSVDNSSTAVANNISINVASDTDKSCTTDCYGKSNHVVIADITQFALANVTATTKTEYVTATGYDHMRQLETKTLSQREGDPGYTISVPTPWISSTATAVGNNVSINVGRDLTPTPKVTP